MAAFDAIRDRRSSRDQVSAIDTNPFQVILRRMSLVPVSIPPGAWTAPLALGIAFLSAGSLPAQMSLTETPSCPECTIRLDSVTTLGADSGPGAMRSLPWAIRRNSLGEYVAILSVRDEAPFVFHSDGSFKQRIGRPGEGPGEYRAPRTLSVYGDTIDIFDRATGRLTSLSPDFEVLSSLSLRTAQVHATARLNDDLILVNMLGPAPDVAGYTLHFLDPQGDPVVVRDLQFHDARDLTSFWRHLARGQNADVWVVNAWGPIRIRRYSDGGVLLEDWGKEDERTGEHMYGNPDRDLPPRQQTVGAWYQEGLLWTVGYEADRRWREGLVQERDGTHGAFYRPSDMSLLYDGVIRVFDTANGTLLASKRVDGSLAERVIGHGLVAQLSTDALGWGYVHVKRATLVKP